jgi:hypothetical protein
MGLNPKNMKKTTKGIILIILFVIIVIVSLIPVAYWWNHPELTKMEIFKEFWELYLGVIVAYIGAQIFKYKIGY